MHSSQAKPDAVLNPNSADEDRNLKRDLNIRTKLSKLKDGFLMFYKKEALEFCIESANVMHELAQAITYKSDDDILLHSLVYRIKADCFERRNQPELALKALEAHLACIAPLQNEKEKEQLDILSQKKIFKVLYKQHNFMAAHTVLDKIIAYYNANYRKQFDAVQSSDELSALRNAYMELDHLKEQAVHLRTNPGHVSLDKVAILFDYLHDIYDIHFATIDQTIKFRSVLQYKWSERIFNMNDWPKAIEFSTRGLQIISQIRNPSVKDLECNLRLRAFMMESHDRLAQHEKTLETAVALLADYRNKISEIESQPEINLVELDYWLTMQMHAKLFACDAYIKLSLADCPPEKYSKVYEFVKLIKEKRSAFDIIKMIKKLRSIESHTPSETKLILAYKYYIARLYWEINSSKCLPFYTEAIVYMTNLNLNDDTSQLILEKLKEYHDLQVGHDAKILFAAEDSVKKLRAIQLLDQNYSSDKLAQKITWQTQLSDFYYNHLRFHDALESYRTAIAYSQHPLIKNTESHIHQLYLAMFVCYVKLENWQQAENLVTERKLFEDDKSDISKLTFPVLLVTLPSCKARFENHLAEIKKTAEEKLNPKAASVNVEPSAASAALPSAASALPPTVSKTATTQKLSHQSLQKKLEADAKAAAAAKRKLDSQRSIAENKARKEAAAAAAKQVANQASTSSSLLATNPAPNTTPANFVALTDAPESDSRSPMASASAAENKACTKSAAAAAEQGSDQASTSSLLEINPVPSTRPAILEALTDAPESESHLPIASASASASASAASASPLAQLSDFAECKTNLKINVAIDVQNVMHQFKPHVIFGVGGSARDALQGKKIVDNDLVTSANIEEIHHIFADKSKYEIIYNPLTSPNLVILKVIKDADGRPLYPALKIDIYSRPIIKTSLKAESLLRNFCFCAIYYNAEGELFDPTGRGILNVQNKRVESILSDEESFSHDPSRFLQYIDFILRGYTGECDLQSHINKLTTVDDKGKLNGAFAKLFADGRGMSAFNFLEHHGVLQLLFPTLPLNNLYIRDWLCYEILHVDQHTSSHSIFYINALFIIASTECIDTATTLIRERFPHYRILSPNQVGLLNTFSTNKQRAYDQQRQEYIHHLYCEAARQAAAAAAAPQAPPSYADAAKRSWSPQMFMRMPTQEANPSPRAQPGQLNQPNISTNKHSRRKKT